MKRTVSQLPPGIYCSPPLPTRVRKAFATGQILRGWLDSGIGRFYTLLATKVGLFLDKQVFYLAGLWDGIKITS